MEFLVLIMLCYLVILFLTIITLFCASDPLKLSSDYRKVCKDLIWQSQTAQLVSIPETIVSMILTC